MGRDLAIDFRLSPVPDALPEEENIDLARQNALSGRTRNSPGTIQNRASGLRQAPAKSAVHPRSRHSLSFFLAVHRRRLAALCKFSRHQFKWDIYDWGYKKHLMDEKQRQIEQSQLNLTETSSQVVLDVSNRFPKIARSAREPERRATRAGSRKAEASGRARAVQAKGDACSSNLQTEQANMAQAVSAISASTREFLERARRLRKSDGDGLNPMSKNCQAYAKTTMRRSATPQRYASSVANALGGVAYVLAIGCGSAPPTTEPARPTPVAVAEVQEYSGGEGAELFREHRPVHAIAARLQIRRIRHEILPAPRRRRKAAQSPARRLREKRRRRRHGPPSGLPALRRPIQRSARTSPSRPRKSRAGLRPRRRALQSQRAHAKRLRRRESAISTRPKAPSQPRKPPSHKRSKRSPIANCARRWTARSSSAMSS